jgi:hypothetical protein
MKRLAYGLLMTGCGGVDGVSGGKELRMIPTAVLYMARKFLYS